MQFLKLVPLYVYCTICILRNTQAEEKNGQMEPRNRLLKEKMNVSREIFYKMQTLTKSLSVKERLSHEAKMGDVPGLADSL